MVECVKQDLQLVRGIVFLSLKQKRGIKHAVPLLGRRLLEDFSEVILLIDAKNAFNSLYNGPKNIRKL